MARLCYLRPRRLPPDGSCHISCLYLRQSGLVHTVYIPLLHTFFRVDGPVYALYIVKDTFIEEIILGQGAMLPIHAGSVGNTAAPAAEKHKGKGYNKSQTACRPPAHG